VGVRVNRLMKPLGRQGSDIGLAGQHPAQAADGAFDPALLPGGVLVAEEGFYPEGMEVVMPGEPVDGFVTANSLARCCTSFVSLGNPASFPPPQCAGAGGLAGRAF